RCARGGGFFPATNVCNRATSSLFLTAFVVARGLFSNLLCSPHVHTRIGGDFGVQAHPLDADVRAELRRILSSELFSRSDRLTAFLRFIVEDRKSTRLNSSHVRISYA